MSALDKAEVDLVTRSQAGDAGAFGDLVRLHRQGVINVVFRMCGDAALAEDAAQEAFVRAWQQIGRYEPRSPLRNWLYRIATNVAIDVLRRQRQTIDVDELQLASPETGPEARVEERERSRIVQEAVLALPPASRAALVLREYEGLSYREIADALAIPVGTVMSRLNYARNRLREVLVARVEWL
ncbi:MAG: sigma-70 family RNA polymerase sigma factor [Anaerolineales bacterium]|nr:MAG: sigma-70 family RNA polymerase sigma factor [Anaerolineales bacterium]